MSTNSVSTAKIVEKNYKHPSLEFELEKVLWNKYDDNYTQYEKWGDIPNYKGYFQVSTFGRVKSLQRKSEREYRPFIISEKILSTQNTQGYYTIGLSKNGKRKNLQVHQLVAIVFLKHTPSKFYKVVDHKDNNPLNNNISNLQVISQRLNSSKDKFRGNYTSKYVGVNWNPKRKKWRSSIYINGKDKHLGYFNCEKEASKYYQNALKSIKNGTEIKVKRRTESSQYKGVYMKGKGWASRIQVGKDRIYLGTFDTELEAHKAYTEAEAIQAKKDYLEIHDNPITQKPTTTIQ